MSQILGLIHELTWQNFIIHIVFTVALAYLLKLLASAFGLFPKNKRLYWLATTLSILVVVILFETIAFPQPRLWGTLDYITTIKPPVPRKAAVLLIITIHNAGSPSTVEGWQASVKVPGQDSQLVAFEKEMLPEVLNIPGQPGVNTIVLYGSDAIDEKTATTPIPQGGAAKGILLFDFDNVSSDEISVPGTTFNLSFKDVNGTNYTISYTAPRERETRPMHFPGLKSGPEPLGQ